MNIGDKIRVNKGAVQTLVEINHPFGLFKSEMGQFAINMSKLTAKEIVYRKPIDDNCLKRRLIREQIRLNTTKDYNSHRAFRIKNILKIRYGLY